MKSPIKTTFFCILSLSLIVGFLTPIFQNVNDFSVNITTGIGLLEPILLFASSIIVFILFFHLLPRYKSQPTSVGGLMLAVLLFYSLSTGVQGLFTLIKFNNIFFQTFWGEIFYFFLAAAIYFLASFNIEVFYSDAPKWRRNLISIVVGINCELFVGFIVYDILFSSNVPELAVFSLLFLVTALYVYSSLAYASFKQRNKPVAENIKKGFLFIGLSGISFDTSFIILFGATIWRFVTPKAELNELMYEITIALSLSFLIVALVFLYNGFIQPQRKTNTTK